MTFARISAIVLLAIIGVGARFGIVAYHRNQAEAARRRSVSERAIRDMRAALDRGCREEPTYRQSACAFDTELRVARGQALADGLDR